MAIEIRIYNDKYFLKNSDNGFSLKIDCAERIYKYNLLQYNHESFTNVEGQLYRDFYNSIYNNDGQELENSIDKLINIYKLQRNPPFHGYDLAPIILRDRDIINETPQINVHDINGIVNSFNNLNRRFSSELNRGLFPETSLSKVLHFCKRDSFWIFDSNIGAILKIFGYSGKFNGYVELLKDLFSNTKFEGFKIYILGIDSNMPERNFLKILDKILWLR